MRIAGRFKHPQTGVAEAGDGGGGEFDGDLAAEEIEENLQALPLGHDLGDHRLQAVQRAVGNLHCLTRLDCILDDMDLVGANGSAQFVEDLVGDGWAVGAEAHDSG